MEKLVLLGKNKTQGRIKVSGSKNAILPIFAASLLADGECYLHDVPGLADVETMRKLLETMGVKIYKDGSTYAVNSKNITYVEAPENYVRKMRASILVLGPLLAKKGEAKISLPGGCSIGCRPIDLHLKGLTAMGAEFEIDHGNIEAYSKGRLKGNKVYLDFPSVGATENIMMAASLAEGTTIIENAAEEPEIVDLANFLNSMGGRVLGAGTNIIKIEGVERLNGVNHTVIPDRIEAGTFMMTAAATEGDVLVDNIIIDHLKPVVAKLNEAGVETYEQDDGVRVKSKGILKPIDIKTLPYPGFPTDMQPQIMALMTIAAGTSVVTETVFENRFMHANEFRRMGADIVIEGHSAVVKGVPKLTGADVKASDLRAGAALIISGLISEGETRISSINHIERGYEDIVEKLKGIGVDIKRKNFIDKK